jgi:hypothetical protein
MLVNLIKQTMTACHYNSIYYLTLIMRTCYIPHTNLHKVINLAKVHTHIARTGYIYKKDTKHAFHLKWSDQPCWAEFLFLITH